MDETFGQALRRLRSQRALSQDAVGRRAHISGGYVSELELGKKDPNLDLAARLDEATNAGGELVRIAEHLAVQADPAWPAVAEQDEAAQLDGRVLHSQDEWRRTRRALNTRRPALTQFVTQVYDPKTWVGDTGLIADPRWIPSQPVEIAAINLTYQPDATLAAVDGTEPASAHVRPSVTLTRSYQRYTQAIRDLDRPRMFENRTAWRLLDLEWAASGGHMGFGPTTYFGAVDVCEAVAHEAAYVYLNDEGALATGHAHLRDLPLRRFIGDPLDLNRLAVMTAVSTLTVRGGSAPRFLLHRRDSRNVTIAGGMLQVIPSGIFQPSSVAPGPADADFDLWRNIQREYAEELLGHEEHDGDGRPISYLDEPFASMDAARAAGLIRVHCLGVALDALTLIGEILTVAVIEPEVFDEMARDFVQVNDEGTVLNERLPFTPEVVSRLLASGRISPAGAGCLALAIRHRDLLL